jgi:hypothetical protein
MRVRAALKTEKKKKENHESGLRPSGADSLVEDIKDTYM